MSGELRSADPLFDLEGKVIVIAGAAAGLGRVIAKALIDRGARLILTDKDAAGLQEISSSLVGETSASLIDVTNEREVEALMEDGLIRFGRIDGLVNAVGIYSTAPAVELDVALFRQTLDVNVTAALLLSRATAKAMDKKGGRIVHIASVSSFVTNINYAAYGTSKAALAQLVRLLAREWAPKAITVNAIGPAMTETNLSRKYMADPDFRAQALSAIPLGRFGLAEDLIGATLLLLGPAGNFITGQILYVDGGRTLV